MNNIQKKTLEHIKEEIDKIDSIKIYTSVSMLLSEMKFSSEDRDRILKVLDEKRKEYIDSHVRESKQWLTALLSDII